MTDKHDFKAYLEEANRWEGRLEKVIHNIVWEEGQKIEFGDNPDAQRRGIDISLLERSFDGVQLKVRDPKWCCDDVFIETISVVKANKPGWVYTYDNTVVAYCWKNKIGDNFQDGVLLLINDEFRMWFDAVKGDYPEKITNRPSVRNGEEWYTKGVPIPVKDIPRGFIRTEFDPRIPTDVVTNQTKLGDV